MADTDQAPEADNQPATTEEQPQQEVTPPAPQPTPAPQTLDSEHPDYLNQPVPNLPPDAEKPDLIPVPKEPQYSPNFSDAHGDTQKFQSYKRSVDSYWQRRDRADQVEKYRQQIHGARQAAAAHTQEYGLIYHNDENGHPKPLLDAQGNQVARERKGPVQYDPKGQPYQVIYNEGGSPAKAVKNDDGTTSYFPSKKIVNPDADAKIGPNPADPTDPNIYRQNQHTSWEAIDPEKGVFSPDSNLALESAKHLHGLATTDLSNQRKDLILENRKLTDGLGIDDGSSDEEASGVQLPSRGLNPKQREKIQSMLDSNSDSKALPKPEPTKGVFGNTIEPTADEQAQWQAAEDQRKKSYADAKAQLDADNQLKANRSKILDIDTKIQALRKMGPAGLLKQKLADYQGSLSGDISNLDTEDATQKVKDSSAQIADQSKQLADQKAQIDQRVADLNARRAKGGTADDFAKMDAEQAALQADTGKFNEAVNWQQKQVKMLQTGISAFDAKRQKEIQDQRNQLRENPATTPYADQLDALDTDVAKRRQALDSADGISDEDRKDAQDVLDTDVRNKQEAILGNLQTSQQQVAQQKQEESKALDSQAQRRIDLEESIKALEDQPGQDAALPDSQQLIDKRKELAGMDADENASAIKDRAQQIRDDNKKKTFSDGSGYTVLSDKSVVINPKSMLPDGVRPEDMDSWKDQISAAVDDGNLSKEQAAQLTQKMSGQARMVEAQILDKTKRAGAFQDYLKEKAPDLYARSQSGETQADDQSALDAAAKDFLKTNPTLLEKIWDPIRKTAQGFVSGSVVTGAITLAGNVTGSQFLKDIASAPQEYAAGNDPRLQESLIGKTGEGLGNIAGFISSIGGLGSALEGAGMVEKAASIVAQGTVGGIQAANAGTEFYRQAVDAGADKATAATAGILSGMVNLAMLAPVGHYLQGFAPPIKNIVLQGLAKSSIEAINFAALQGGTTLANNAIAQMAFDKNRDLFEGVLGETGQGGIQGMILGVISAAVGHYRLNALKQQYGLGPDWNGKPETLFIAHKQIEQAEKNPVGKALAKQRDAMVARLADPETTDDQKKEIIGNILAINAAIKVDPISIPAEGRRDLLSGLLKVSQGVPLEKLTEAERANLQKAKNTAGVPFIQSGPEGMTLTDTARSWMGNVAPHALEISGSNQETNPPANPPGETTGKTTGETAGNPPENPPSGKSDSTGSAPVTSGDAKEEAARATAVWGSAKPGDVFFDGDKNRIEITQDGDGNRVARITDPDGKELHSLNLDQLAEGDYNTWRLYGADMVKAEAPGAPPEAPAAPKSASEIPDARPLTSKESKQADALSKEIQRQTGAEASVADAFARQQVRDGNTSLTKAVENFRKAGGVENPQEAVRGILASEAMGSKATDKLLDAYDEHRASKGQPPLTADERAKIRPALERLAPEIEKWNDAFSALRFHDKADNAGGAAAVGKNRDILEINIPDLFQDPENLQLLMEHPERAALLISEEAIHALGMKILSERSQTEGRTPEWIASQLADETGRKLGSHPVADAADAEAAWIFNQLPAGLQEHVRKTYGDSVSKPAWVYGHEFLRMLAQHDIAIDRNGKIHNGKAILSEGTFHPSVLQVIRNHLAALFSHFTKLSQILRKKGVSEEGIKALEDVRENIRQAIKSLRERVDEKRLEAYQKEYDTNASKSAAGGIHQGGAGVVAPSERGSNTGELAQDQGPQGKNGGVGAGGVEGAASGIPGVSGVGGEDAELQKRLAELEAEKAEREAAAERAEQRRTTVVQKQAENTADKEKLLAKVPEEAKPEATTLLQKVHMGDPTYVLGANREKLPAVYIAVPPGEVQTSHAGEDFHKNPEYGGENTRSYHSDETEQNKVRSLALPGALDEDSLVSDVKSAADGPPQVVLTIFNDSEGKPKVRLQTAGGNGREQGVNLAGTDDQERLTDAWKAKSGNFGLTGMPEGWRGYRFLGVYDLRDEAQNRAYLQLVDKLNPNQGVVQDTASRADIDAALKIPSERLSGLSLTMSPKSAQDALLGLVRDSEKLGLDRNLMAGLVKNPTQAQFYMQRLLLAAAFRSKPLSEFFTKSQLTNGHATVVGLIKAATGTALRLRDMGHGNIAEAIGRTLETISDYVNRGDKIGTAIRKAADQAEMGEDGSVIQALAAALEKKVEYLDQNKKGIKPVDSEGTIAGFESLMADIGKAMENHRPEPDMFGNAPSVGDTIKAAIDAHFRKEAAGEANPRAQEGEGGQKLNARGAVDPVKRMRQLMKKRGEEGLNRYETDELTRLEKAQGQHFMGFFDEARNNDFSLESQSEKAPSAPTEPASQMKLFSRSAGIHVEERDVQAYLDFANVPQEKRQEAKKAIAAASKVSTKPYDLPNAGGVDRDELRQARDKQAAAYRAIHTGDAEAVRNAIKEGVPLSKLIEAYASQKLEPFAIQGAIINSPADLAAHNLVHRTPFFESLKVAVLDHANQVIHSELISVGTLNESIAHPRDIMRAYDRAKVVAASRKQKIQGWIVMHNHPGGDPSPSSADQRLTQRLHEVAGMLGAPLLDHVITNGETYYSFHADGMLGVYKGTGIKTNPKAKPKLQVIPKPEGLTPGKMADFEAVPASEVNSNAINSDEAIERVRALLQTADPGMIHVLHLSTRLGLIAVERHPLNAKPADFFQRAAANGSYGISLSLPNTSRNGVPVTLAAPLWRSFIREVEKVGVAYQVPLIDAAVKDYSFKVAGMLEQPASYEKSAREQTEILSRRAPESESRVAAGKLLSAAARRSGVDEAGFYSKLEDVIDKKIQGKQVVAQSLKALLAKSDSGIKPEEIKWSGINDIIDRIASENAGKVPKDALLEHLHGAGKVRFEERNISNAETDKKIASLKEKIDSILKNDPEFQRLSDLWENTEWEKRKELGIADKLEDREIQLVGDLNEELRDVRQEHKESAQPKYSKYTLPGGENYREVVLTMPPNGFEERLNNRKAIWEKYEDRLAELQRRINRNENRAEAIAERDSLEAEREQEASQSNATIHTGETYTSSHFTDIPNYVAHMRVDDRTDSSGRPGLFIEEIQSDRHQKGRTEGYIGDESVLPKGYRIEPSPIFQGEFILINPQGESLGGAKTRDDAIEKARMDIGASRGAGKVPDAPFRNSSAWGLQMFKRALRDAVSSGKEWIGWTSGDTQAERYNLSKEVSSIDYIPSTQRLRAFDLGGQGIMDEVVPQEKLADYVGKDAADKLLATKPYTTGSGKEAHILSGVDLKVGGEGMKGFYDQILPKEIGKYVKQWGAKVEQGYLDPKNPAVRGLANDDEATGVAIGARPVWKIAITPEMREGIDRGQPLFSRRASHGQPDLFDDQLDLFIHGRKEAAAYNDALEKEGITHPEAKTEAAMQDLGLSANQADDLFSSVKPPEPAPEQEAPTTNPSQIGSKLVDAPAGTDLFGNQTQRGEIGDFGEKIAGARKDAWRQFSDAMSQELPEDSRDITLSKNFPEPDYAKLIEAGIDPNRLAAFKAMRDMIPRKPTHPYKLARWTEVARAVHKAMQGFLDKDSNITEAAFMQSASKISTSIYSKAMLYRELGYPMFLDAKEWSVEQGRGTTMWDRQGNKIVTPDQMFTQAEFKDRGTDIHSTNPDRLAAFREIAAKVKERIEIAQRAKGGAGQTSNTKRTAFSIYRDRSSGEFFIGRKGLTSVLRVKAGFTSLKDTRDYLENRYDELANTWEGMKTQTTGRNDTNAPREGKSPRTGDVSPEQFGEAFGFRGVQFGNYVENTRRQTDLNHAFDALMDLAEAIGVPPKALSLDGQLGLAFGARGTGGKNAALAHYEPDHVAINLTKNGGPGTLAHEWFHALDNYFSRFNSTGKTDHAFHGEYATNQSRPAATVRPEVWEAFRNLKKALDNPGFTKRSRELDETRSKPYWNTTIEKAARAFEQYAKERLAERGISNDYLANISPGSGAYPKPEEMKEGGIRQAFDQLFNTLDTRETDRGQALYSRGQGVYEKTIEDELTKIAEPHIESPHADRRGGLAGRLEAQNALDAARAFFSKDGFALRPLNLRERSKVGEFTKAIGGLFGRRIVEFKQVAGEGILHGFIDNDQPGLIFLNSDQPALHFVTLGHELWHHIENSAPQLAEQLRGELLPLLKNADRLQAKYPTYALRDSDIKAGITDPDYRRKSEAIADLFSSAFANPDVWEKLAAKNPSLFGKVAAAIRDWLGKVMSKLRSIGADGDEHFTDLEKAHDMISQALHEFAQEPFSDSKTLPRREPEVSHELNYSLRERDDAQSREDAAKKPLARLQEAQRIISEAIQGRRPEEASAIRKAVALAAKGYTGEDGTPFLQKAREAADSIAPLGGRASDLSGKLLERYLAARQALGKHPDFWKGYEKDDGKTPKIGEAEVENMEKAAAQQPAKIPEPQPERPESGNPILDALNRYEQGDEEISTPDDLVNELDGLSVQIDSPELEDAVRDWRDAHRENRELWGERGDMDAETEKLISAARKAAQGIKEDRGTPLHSRGAADPIDGYMDRLDDLVDKARKEEAAGGKKEIGNPYLAYGDASPEHRAVDEFYGENVAPETRSEWEEGGAKIAADPKTRTSIEAKGYSGQVLTPEETVAADIISRNLRRAYLADPSEANRSAFYKFWNSYRMTGTAAGRALAARVDPYQTPQERFRSFLLDLATKPSAKFMKGLEGKDPAEKATMIDAETKRLLDKLAEAGIKPEDILQDRVRLTLADKKIKSWLEALYSRGATSEHSPKRIALQMMMAGKTFDQIAKATGLTKEEQMDLKKDAIQKLRDEHFKKFERGAKAYGSSLITGKVVDPAEAEAEFNKWINKLGIVPDEKQGKNRFSIDDPAHVVRLAKAIQDARGEASKWDMAIEAWKMGLLSGPHTHIYNFLGHAGNALYTLTVQRGMEGLVNLAMNDSKGARLGEFQVLAKGLLPGIAAGYREALRSWSAEHDFFENSVLGTPLELDRVNRGLKDAPMGKIPEKIKIGSWTLPLVSGKKIRIPGRAVLFADAFIRNAVAHMEAGAHAYRMARTEGLSGDDLTERITQLTKTRGQIISDYSHLTPSKEMVTHFAHRLAARDETLDPMALIADHGSDAWSMAREQTAFEAAKKDGWTDEAWKRAVSSANEIGFKQELKSWKDGGNIVEGFSEIIQGARNEATNPLARVFLNAFFPFVRTPYDIMRIGVRRAFGAPNLAYQAAKGARAVMKGGNYLDAHPTAVRDIAEQILTLGLGALVYGAVAGDKDDQEKMLLINGAAPAKSKEDGKGFREMEERLYGGPYTIRIGGRNGLKIPFGRLEPAGTVLGSVVDTIHAIKSKAPSSEQMHHVWSYLTEQVKEKSFLQGMNTILEMTDAAKDSGPLDSAKRMILQAWVPNLIRDPLRSLDPVVRESKTAPAAYTSLPYGGLASPRIDAYGEETKKGGGLLSRIFLKTAIQTSPHLIAADRLLENWNRENPSESWAPQPPKPVIKIHGKEQQMTATETERFQKASGQLAKAKLGSIVNARNSEHPTKDDLEAVKKAFSDAHREAKDRLFTPAYLTRRP